MLGKFLTVLDRDPHNHDLVYYESCKLILFFTFFSQETDKLTFKRLESRTLTLPFIPLKSRP